MSEIISLNSKIFTTGTKFVVADNTKDSTFGPGTTGFISYVKGHDQDYPNVVYLQVVIVKRGKTGKRRLDNAEISTPIFDLEDANISKIMPDEKRRYYVHIDLLPIEDNIKSMSDIDFLGWAHAQAAYIYKLSTRAKHISVWPKEGENILNKILSIHEYYNEETNDKYTLLEVRDKFAWRIRMLESTLVKCALLYMVKVAELEKRAISDLCTDGLNIGDPVAMKETLSLFDNKYNSLQTLLLGHGKKEMAAAVKTATAGILW